MQRPYLPHSPTSIKCRKVFDKWYYSLLRHDVQSAVNIVGFDPYLGYLHYERYGRPSLALDLME